MAEKTAAQNARTEIPKPAIAFREKVWVKLLIVASLAFFIGVWKNSGASQTDLTSSELKFPLCQDQQIVRLTKLGVAKKQRIHEDCLSGEVRLPFGVSFISDAPGWAEYWFVTPDGYKVFQAEDLKTTLAKTTLPSCTLRIRGKEGWAEIQIGAKR
mgnify:CR=1 FL=1